MATKFLFDSFGSKDPNSTRKQHLKTVYDILQLSILQKDIPRAQKAWSILIRCPEFNASSLWKIGLGLVRNQSQESLEQLSFLRSTMLSSNDSVCIPRSPPVVSYSGPERRSSRRNNSITYQSGNVSRGFG